MVNRSDLGVDLEVVDDLKARAEPLDATRVGSGSVGNAGKLMQAFPCNSGISLLLVEKLHVMLDSTEEGRDIHLLSLTYIS